MALGISTGHSDWGGHCSGMTLGQQCGMCGGPDPGWASQPSLITGITDINKDRGCDSITDPDMALGSSPVQDMNMAPGRKQVLMSVRTLKYLTLQICLSLQDLRYSVPLSHALTYFSSP